MCDCPICNRTEEEQQADADEYIEWEYKQYCEGKEKPLTMNEWFKTIQ